MGEKRVKWGLEYARFEGGQHSIGICIAQDDWNGELEAYAYITLIWIRITIGRFYH